MCVPALPPLQETQGTRVVPARLLLLPLRVAIRWLQLLSLPLLLLLLLCHPPRYTHVNMDNAVYQ